MTLRYLFIVFLIISGPLKSQTNPVIDSLSFLLQKTSSDSTKAQLLSKLAHAYINVDSKKAREIATEAVVFANQTKNYKSQIDAINELANLDRNAGDFLKALAKVKNALIVAQNIKDTLAIGKCYMGIGDIYFSLESYEKSVLQYQKAYELYQKAGNIELSIMALNRVGNRHMDMGRTRNDSSLCIKAISYYEEAKAIAEKSPFTKQYINTIVSLADAFNILGHVAKNKHHLYTSFKYSLQSLKLAQQNYMKEYQGISYLNLGEVCLNLNKEIKAINYFELAEKIYSDVGNKGWLLNTYAFLGKAYFTIHLYDKAIYYIEKTVEIAQEQKLSVYLRDNYLLLSDIYKKKNDYQTAYNFYKLYNNQKDTVINDNTMLHISRLQAELDLERKDREIEVLTKNTEIQNQQIKSQLYQRNVLAAGIAVLCFIIIVGIYLFYQKKKTTQKILQAKIAAEQAKEAQEQFLANTSHEIRTPMNGIIGMTHHLMDTPLTAQQKEYISAIKDSSDNLLALINQLLDLSKIMAKKINFENKPFEVREIIKNLVRLLEFRTQEKNISISVAIDDAVPTKVIGDPIRLKQILLNLVENAIKFTHNGGVKITAELIEENEESLRLNFVVEDTGIGIPESKLDLIFENFAQVNARTTRKYGGTGLGLPISKQLVEQQGGTISVKSQLNSGSVFSFVLPFKKVNTNNLTEVNTSQFKHDIPVADLQGLRVLVVDDTKINQQVAALTLQKWNTQVLIANSAREAFDILNNDIIQIILMDVTMPEMDGYEATKYIRNNFKNPVCNVPIIAITAAAFVGDREKCLAAGMNDYISKPFNPELLLKAIVNLIPTTQLTHQENSLSDLSLLYERAAGDNQFIKEMLECYIQELPLYVTEMELFLEQKDWNEVSKQAHKMKSPIALIGATKLQTAYTKIELEALIQDKRHDVVNEIRQAQKQCLDLVEELKTELQKFNS